MTINTRVFPVQNFSNYLSAIPQMIRFLINDHSTYTGPGWTIVEAYDGTTREIPSISSDMDSFSSGFAWRNNNPGVGSWIVLESTNAHNLNHFQVYFEIDSTSQMEIMMIPFEDFQTGGDATTLPLFPTSSFGSASGSLYGLTGFTSEAQYTVVADEGSCIILNDRTGSAAYMTYIGEIDTTYGSADVRSYVVRDGIEVGVANGPTDLRYAKLSVMDNKTVINEGSECTFYTPDKGSSVHHGTVRDNLLGPDSIIPVGLWFDDPGHSYFAGWLRNFYSAPFQISTETSSGTFNNSSYIFRRNEISEAFVVLPFDGSSSFGPDLSGTLVSPPQVSSRSFSFYSVEPDYDSIYIFYTSGSTSAVTSSVQPTVQNESVKVLDANVDRNRLKITYPSKRRKPRLANISK